jgi:UDP-N-acetylglucosamine--N-acetylmuramyl-(pentapeptide) pyrophosphoryl-undecaprenol N-acetylglucosamine transferase
LRENLAPSFDHEDDYDYDHEHEGGGSDLGESAFPGSFRMSRFLISCGGTGGHLSPGIALAEGLASAGHEATLLISQKKVDARLIEKYPHFRFERVPGSGFSWKPAQLIRCVVSQLLGFRFCENLVRKVRPNAIVAFGGFTSAPLVLAAVLHRVPIALHESNRVPGRAIRMLGRLARRVYLPPGVTLAGVSPSKTRSAGQPVRREIVRHPAAEARVALGLSENEKVLVVLGGSQGASALNGWVRRQLPLLSAEGVQVYCITGLGKDQQGSVELKTKTGGPIRAIFEPFSDRMSELLSAADLVVSRAGAGTIAELIRCETPAILVPFPHAADNHQQANAAFFEQQGGGIVVEETQVADLHRVVVDTILDDSLLRRFRENLRRMNRTDPLDLVLRDLEELIAAPSTPANSAQMSAI